MKISILFLAPYALGKVAHKVTKAIQESRKSYGLGPLEVIKSIVEISRDRAEELAESYEKYSNSQYLKKAVETHKIKMIAMGENNGKSRNKEKDGIDIFEEWLKSEKHRKNIVNTPEYTHLGVYTVKTETNLYISAVFFQLGDEKNSKKPQKSTQEKTNAKEESNGLVIRSSHMGNLEGAALNLISQSMLVGAVGGNSRAQLAESIPTQPLEKRVDKPESLDNTKSQMNTIQLLYPDSVNIANLSKNNKPIRFVYQQQESGPAQKVYHQIIENPSAPSKILNLNNTPVDTSKLSFSPQVSGQAQNDSISTLNTISNPNPKAIIKLIMIQPAKSSSNSTIL